MQSVKLFLINSVNHIQCESILENLVEMLESFYLKFYHINVGNVIPTRRAVFVETIETQTWVITNGIREKPGVIILKTNQHRRYY